MIQPDSIYAARHKPFVAFPWGGHCFPAKPRHLKHKGPGNAKSYLDRPGSGLLTRKEIERKRRQPEGRVLAPPRQKGERLWFST